MSEYRRDQPRAARPLGLGLRGQRLYDSDRGTPFEWVEADSTIVTETGTGGGEPLRAAQTIGLSVIVPARNEAAGLELLIAEIAATLRPWCDSKGLACQTNSRPNNFEIIVVDDGSMDSTLSVLRKLSGSFPELRVLRFAHGAGQTSALVAGLYAARSDWVATLDADLQNDPADLPVLWEALEGGFDAALGWRETRRDSWMRRSIGRIANLVRNAVLGQSIHDTGCSVRIFRRDIALRLPMWDGAHRFLGSLLVREGCRIVQVPTRHRVRRYGQSHYNLRNRSLRVIVDLVGVAWLSQRRLQLDAVELRLVEAGGGRRGSSSVAGNSSHTTDLDLTLGSRAGTKCS